MEPCSEDILCTAGTFDRASASGHTFDYVGDERVEHCQVLGFERQDGASLDMGPTNVVVDIVD